MELYATHIFVRDDRCEARPIFSLANHNLFIRRLEKERMHKIEERVVAYPFEQRMRFFMLDQVPPNMRNRQISFESSHSAPQQTQAARVAELFGFLKQHLHPDAHTQQRRAFSHA